MKNFSIFLSFILSFNYQIEDILEIFRYEYNMNDNNSIILINDRRKQF